MPFRLDTDKEKAFKVMNDRERIKKRPSWLYSSFPNMLVPAPAYDTVGVSYDSNDDAIIRQQILGM